MIRADYAYLSPVMSIVRGRRNLPDPTVQLLAPADYLCRRLEQSSDMDEQAIKDLQATLAALEQQRKNRALAMWLTALRQKRPSLRSR